MAQQQQARKPTIKAEVQVIDELSPQEARNGVRVRAKAAKGHEGDARPVGGFFIKRRYEGDEFVITKPEQFSSVWMEFVDEPPKAWLNAMKVNEENKARLMAKAREDQANNAAESFMFAMSQVLARSQGRSPNDFDHSSGQFKQAPPAPSAEAI